ncbi:MAG: hypothetical protein E7618_06300 [Ruminococcaceae bacterium]|nr:hypothetical protein [Oscillospiraceae bacterium]
MPIFIAHRASRKPVLPVIREHLLMYAIGSVAYTGLELLYRGYTHVSMVVTGGICLLIIHLVCQRLSRHSLLFRACLGAFIITCTEFLVGCLVNLVLDWQVWDYSSYAMNLWGQICPLYCFYWFLLSFPAVMISDIVAISMRPCLAGELFFGQRIPTVKEVPSDAKKEKKSLKTIPSRSS